MGRLIEILNDVAIESKCNRDWTVAARKISPLESLARATQEEDDFFGTSSEEWLFECRKHRAQFPMGTNCPHTYVQYSEGESVVVDNDMAERLVRSGRAAYPTHKHEVEHGVQATLDRANTMLESMGLPGLDAESLGVINATTRGSRGTSRYYAKPTDTRLAGELGLSPGDIAEMRKLSGR